MANLPPGPIADARNIVTPAASPCLGTRSSLRRSVWTKTADEIPETLATYCRRINDSGH